MDDTGNTNEQLLTTLALLRERIAELELEAAEAKPQTAQLRLQSAALNAAADAIVITDRAGLIQWVNPAFSDLTGYAAAEAVGKDSRELVKSDRHDQAFYKNSVGDDSVREGLAR